MKYPVWITQAVNAGGLLTVRAILPGNGFYIARMDWPQDDSIVSAPCTSVASAVEELERKLMEDAALEMQKAGAV